MILNIKNDRKQRDCLGILGKLIKKYHYKIKNNVDNFCKSIENSDENEIKCKHFFEALYRKKLLLKYLNQKRGIDSMILFLDPNTTVLEFIISKIKFYKTKIYSKNETKTMDMDIYYLNHLTNPYYRNIFLQIYGFQTIFDLIKNNRDNNAEVYESYKYLLELAQTKKQNSISNLKKSELKRLKENLKGFVV